MKKKSVNLLEFIGSILTLFHSQTQIIINIFSIYRNLSILRKKYYLEIDKDIEKSILECVSKRTKEEARLRLSQALHESIKIDLNFSEKSEYVGVFCKSISTNISNDSQKIQDIFLRDDVQGKLLLLGEPGSGKTIELLQLALFLVTRSQENYDEPIPIIIDLNTWKLEKGSFHNWLAEQIILKTSCPNNFIEMLLNGNKFLPMLDGLDELGIEVQAKCIGSINEWLSEDNQRRIFICCRYDEYIKCGQKLLKMNSALVLKSLNRSQIKSYLRETNNIRLWNSLSRNSELFDLAKKPIFLYIIVYSFIENNIQSNYELFDLFVKKQLSDLINYSNYKIYKSLNLNKFYKYMLWLSQQFESNIDAEFLIENLGVSNLSRKSRFYFRWLYGSIIGLIILVLYFSLLTLMGNPLEGIVIGILFSFTHAMIALSRGNVNSINLSEDVVFSFKKFLLTVIKWLSIGILSGILLEVFCRYLFVSNDIGLLIGVFIGVYEGFIIGIKDSVGYKVIGDRNIYPNQGIWATLKNAFLISLIFFFVGGLLFYISSTIFMFVFLTKYSISKIFFWSLIGSLIGLIFGLSSSLGNVNQSWFFSPLKHLIVRFLLFQEGCIPWNYARFLKIATSLKCIQRVDGKYRFVHELLREYFSHT